MGFYFSCFKNEEVVSARSTASVRADMKIYSGINVMKITLSQKRRNEISVPDFLGMLW
jgi:hypothetical protein